MRVQLLNPPVRHYQGVGYGINPPLGLPLLAAVLRNAGHVAEVYDLEALGVGPERVRERYANDPTLWPDWIGITAMTSSAQGMRDTIKALRDARYSGRIVVGGVHATIDAPDCIAAGADLVVRGECEGNIVDLLEGAASGVVDGQAAPIADIPAPAWRYMAPKPYQYGGNAPHLSMPEAITMWTRGCPYECVFCGNAIFSPSKKRCRPVPAIVAELEQLRDYGTRSLFAYDDELLGVKLPQGWLHDLCDALAPMRYVWKTQGRCDPHWATPEVLRDVYRAGCRAVMWGVESFSPKVLKSLGKGTNPEWNWEVLRASKAAGLKNFVFSMIGNAEETEDDLRITCDALGRAYREGLVDYRQTTVVTALPGTRLWARQKAEGWWEATPVAGPQMAQVYRDTPWLTGERIAYWLGEFARACPVGIEG